MDGFWREMDRLDKDRNFYRAGFLQFVGVAESREEAVKLYAEPAEYFYDRSLHISLRFVSPPGYATEATQRAGLESQVSMAATSKAVRYAERARRMDDNDRWTQVWSRLNGAHRLIDNNMKETAPDTLQQMVDYETMEHIRDRIDQIVSDRKMAESLKPWYNFLCKRPLYSDTYLESFNCSNVTLIDTQGRGVDRITENALIFDGESYMAEKHVDYSRFEAECTPGYYSNEGSSHGGPSPWSSLYGGGPIEYVQVID
jgi:hypothetical protein